MNMVFATASQLAQMIRDRKVLATEILNAYLEKIGVVQMRVTLFRRLKD